MPDLSLARQTRRPTEGYFCVRLRPDPRRPVCVYVPPHYQPHYRYPLVMVFHAAGCNELWAVSWATRVSERNFIIACPRGPVRMSPDDTGLGRFAWPDSPVEADPVVPALIDWLSGRYPIHRQRVFLLGFGAGCVPAARLAGLLPEVAGVALIPGDQSLTAARAARLAASIPAGVKLFVVGEGQTRTHGAAWHAAYSSSCKLAAEPTVTDQPAAVTTPVNTFRDLNRWILQAVAQQTLFPPVEV